LPSELKPDQLSLIHIDDVVEAVYLAVSRLNQKLASDRSGFWPSQPARLEVFDVLPPSSVPISRLVQKMLTLTYSLSAVTDLGELSRQVPTARKTRPSPSARILHGWRPKVSLDQGLRALAVAYLTSTAHYLFGKLSEDTCTGTISYSHRDLLALNGCAGIIGIRMEQEISYLDRQDSIFVSTVAPAEYTFLVEEDQGDVIFSVKNQSGYLYTLSTSPGEEETRFKARVDTSTGYISLASLSSGLALTQLMTNGEQACLSDEEAPFIWRLSPHCCPGLRTRWPFFGESPLSSAINDRYREVEILFDASTPKTLCQAFKEAKSEALFKLGILIDYPEPITIGQTPLPNNPPYQWRLSWLPPCENSCDHPTICVDTGSCTCVEASCPPRRHSALDAFAYRSQISWPPAEMIIASLERDWVLMKDAAELS